MDNFENENKQIFERYLKRSENNSYSYLNPEIFKMHQERVFHEMKMISSNFNTKDFANLKITDIGSGYGFNILEFIRMGFLPQNITAVEMIKERADFSKGIIPQSVVIYNQNAMEAPIENSSQDIVFQSAVLTSILDDEYKKRLANRMWELLKPGGAILYYDFIYNNPKNPDVKGVPLSEIKLLFPNGKFKFKKRVTLAMPISRAICKIHPSSYHLFNFFKFLRTHLLCLIVK